MGLLNKINWVEKTSAVDELLTEELAISTIPPGMEAEVLKLSSKTNSFVLKIWNRSAQPDVGYQYHLLSALRRRGVPVSAAYGWGYTAANDKVLLTSFDGSPISTLSEQIVKVFAHSLWKLHEIPVDELECVLHKRYDFMDYFYPRLEEHQDIRTELIRLLKVSNMSQNQFIHGDFNLNNFLDHAGEYRIIDWTNAQIGDARYDLAWSSFLIRIYNGELLGALFLHEYLSRSLFSIEEMQIYEAIACLRWLLLNRIADIPKSETTIEWVNDVIMKNTHMNNELVMAN